MEKIVCEDCLVGMKKIPDNRVDLIATDRKRNKNVKYNGGE